MRLELPNNCTGWANFHLQESASMSKDHRRAKPHLCFLAALNRLTFTAVNNTVDQKQASITRLIGLSLVTW